MVTAVIVVILIAVIAISLHGSIKHMKGEGGCCGGGQTTVTEEEKILQNPIGKKIIKIEGMHCQNCKNSVERQINRIEGASCKVDLKKGIAVISYEHELNDEQLKRTIQMLDFKVTEIKNEQI